MLATRGPGLASPAHSSVTIASTSRRNDRSMPGVVPAPLLGVAFVMRTF